jgi:ribosome biogenesis GTPase
MITVATTGQLIGTVLAVQANFYRVQLDQDSEPSLL